MSQKISSRNGFKATILIGSILFMALFSASLVSAFNFDNVASYSNNDMKVNVINMFGIGENYGSLTLKSHSSITEVKSVIAGKDRAVMYYEFDFSDPKEIELGKVKFIDVRTNKEVKKDYYFATPIYKDVVVVDEYVQDCSKLILGICNSIPSKTHTKKVIAGWERLDIKNIPSGKITIALITDVNSGDYIDGIWTVKGVELSKHAVWTEDLNVGLTRYFTLNGTTVLDSTGTQDGSNDDAVTGSTGLIDKAFEFDAVTDSVNLTVGLGGDNFTYSMWILVNSVPTPAQYQLISKSWKADPTSIACLIENGESAIKCYDDDPSGWVSQGTVLQGAWIHVVQVYDEGANTLKTYINGTYASTISRNYNPDAGMWQVGHFSGDTHGYLGKVDEVSFWNRTFSQDEITQLYNSGAGITYRNVFHVAPTVTLNSPVDDYNSTTSTSVTFNATVSHDEFGIKNVTLILDGVYQTTNTSGLNNAEYIETKTLSQGSHTWNFEACNNETASLCANGTERTVNVDTLTPALQVTAPVDNNLYTYITNGDIVDLNWTVTDANIDACWYDYNGTNTTVTCSDNTTSFGIEAGNYDLTFWANDTVGHVNETTINWSYKLFENSQIYSTTTLAGTSEVFSINLTGTQNITLASLVYNSVSYAGVINNNYPEITINRTITTPLVSTATNMTFYWNITLADGNYTTSTSKTQTINSVILDNCTEYSNAIFNFTIKDEETQVELNESADNITAKINVQLYDLSRTTVLSYANLSYDDVNPFGICLYNNMTTSNFYSVDAQVEYDAGIYAKELYHIQNYTINSTLINNTNISLYDLKDASSQEFRIYYKDSSFLAVEGAVIQIQRKYIDEGLFKTVEAPKTDYNGKAVGHLVLNDVIYNFVVVKNGQVLATFNDVVATCEDVVLDNCEITLNSFSSSIPITDFSTLNDFAFTFSINDTSRLVTSTFAIPSGVPSTILLNVSDVNGTFSCTDTLYAISGSLTCTVPTSFGNTTILMLLKKDGSILARGLHTFNMTPRQIYGASVMFLGILLFSTLIGLGISSNPMISGAFLILGVVLAVGLNMVSSGGFYGATSSILWLFIAVVIVLIKGAGRQ